MISCACANDTASQTRSKMRRRSGSGGACSRHSCSVRPCSALHHVERPAVGKHAEIVHGDDAGMLQAGDDPGLARQPGLELGRRQRVPDLDRHLAAERVVECRVDGAHAAAADLRGHLVAIGRELRPAGHGHQVLDGAVGQPDHSTSTPRRSRASRRNSSALPHNARRPAIVWVLNARRVCAR